MNRRISCRTAGAETLIAALAVLFLLVPFLVACGDSVENHDHNGDEHASHSHDHDDHDHDHQDHDHDHPQHSPVENGENGLDLGQEAGEIYTCPMHPQIRRDEPGRCPICGMDLVPQDDADDPEVTISPSIQQAMNIRTAPVERDRLWQRIDTVGRVEYDQTRIHHIHPRTEGWIGELAVSAEGDRVSRGELLYTLYSSELVNAQEEYLQAVRSGDSRMQAASRERLEVLDVQDRVIDRIRDTGRVIRYLPWYAPMDGVITMLDARHGMFVAPGSEIMEITDLDALWLIADVFDGQMDWLETGQPAEIRLTSLPGQTIESEVDYIYPELDPATRTARVRLPLDNPEGRIRPGNWAKVTVFGGARDDLLVIPAEALIRTGHQDRVVVVEDNTRFSAREVHAGMQSGEWIEIRHGLEEGEKVVVSGQFLIDSEASRRAGHDRMGGGHDH